MNLVKFLSKFGKTSMVELGSLVEWIRQTKELLLVFVGGT